MMDKFIAASETAPEDKKPIDDRTKEQKDEDDQTLYSIKNFSL